ncbi:MAG TPA: GNAT family N-acetyltransferase [Burkholderiales bacterium]|nr:GNAT family N-acetyltransferase [Burkholderiales bacterium]
MKHSGRIVAERKRTGAMSRKLWDGLLRYNRKMGGPFHYARTVLTARDGEGRVLGGLILQSYWKESYVELLWLSPRVRRLGYGQRLMREAERLARRRGSRLMHLNTYSFQAPGFYEKLGFKRFGGMRGSPAGESRHFYVKQLTQR